MWWLLLVFASVAWPASPEDGDPDIPLDAVVLLLQGPAACAGAFLDDAGTIVTAYHCVAHGGRPKVIAYDGQEGVGRVTRVNPAMDLALVAVPDLAGSPWLPVRTEAPHLGETVRPIGHPYGARPPLGFVEGTLRWSVSEGVISAVGPRAIQTTAPVNPGNSGGPVVDTEGRLVAVVSRRYSGDGLGFAGRADAVADLMEGGGRRFGPIGGTLALETFLSAYQGGLGSIAIGFRGEMAFRDRVILGLAAAFPLSARWTVARFDSEVRWSQLEGRVGLRQRLFRGQWTTTLEAWGGGAAVQGLVPDDLLVFRNEAFLAPAVGGAIGLGGVTVDFGVLWVDGDAEWRMLVALRWPGVFWMF